MTKQKDKRDRSQIAEVGKVIMATSGCYSDYGVRGVFVVRKAFSPIAELDKFLEANPSAAADYGFYPDDFIGHLAQQGFIEDFPYDDLYLSAYNTASGVSYTPS